MDNILRIAIQKSGRLTKKSLEIFKSAGVEFEGANGQLLLQCDNFPVELMMVRSSDIPEYVRDGVCQLGIVGFNVLEEKFGDVETNDFVEVIRKLNMGKCRLSMAVPNDVNYTGLSYFDGKKIATSYPNTLRNYFSKNNIKCDVIEISGSVEIAPSLKIADGICDIVSTGSTLLSNGLKEVETILKSEAVIMRSRSKMSDTQEKILKRFLQRMGGVMKAKSTKYIMMNATQDALPKIKEAIPGMEAPSVMNLDNGGKIAIHAVCRENIFWETMEKLQELGASSILVLPIEKIIE